MFNPVNADGSPLAAADAEFRAVMERLVEVTQQKGSSECRPGALTSDEQCDFESMWGGPRWLIPWGFDRRALLGPRRPRFFGPSSNPRERAASRAAGWSPPRPRSAQLALRHGRTDLLRCRCAGGPVHGELRHRSQRLPRAHDTLASIDLDYGAALAAIAIEAVARAATEGWLSTPAYRIIAAPTEGGRT